MSGRSLLLAIVVSVMSSALSAVLDNMIDVKQNQAIKEIRILYQIPHKENIPVVYSILRGTPLFVEVDFLPRYIPQGTAYIAVSVIIPEFTCYGRQYVLGFHRERWQMPPCRLCTNTNQTYTMPLVLLLGPESGCYDGRIPTYWKVEAIPFTRPLDDRTDLTIGLAYDYYKQLRICSTTATPYCHNAKSLFFSSRRTSTLPRKTISITKRPLVGRY